MENIKFRGIKNTRDLGGMKVEGGRVKEKMLIRSSYLAFASDEDIAKLVFDYNLKTVIDVRTSTEIQEKPNVRAAGVEFLEMPIFDSSIPGMTHEAKQNLDGIPDMTKLYAAVMRGESVYNLAEVIRRIVLADEGDYAILYHCTEGKDRTGMITAILLSLLGAKREDIIEDYLFTNKVNKKKAVKYYLLVKYLKFNKTAAEKVRGVFLAKEEYINEIFRAIDELWGGIDGFREQVLKLTKEDIENFRRRVTQ